MSQCHVHLPFASSLAILIRGDIAIDLDLVFIKEVYKGT